MNHTKRVGIWIRVSTDIQVQGDSPEHHEKRARYYTESKDWDVVEVYRLDAMTGKSVMEYPETKRMLADIKRGHITGLVFSKLARLARNTKELLEFAEIFRGCNADLISLSESIDTSSPAGRLFYTMIAAMAQWEREEIASRVAASVPVRAKLGKSLGGQASFGYQWNGNTFAINETEAPVRKLIYELFLKHQRRSTTADKLNELGYRTRNGSLFSDTTITRLLRDSTAKGERRANYTQSVGTNKQWTVKPESEWIVQPCPAIVSAELWNECNSILDAQEKRRTPVGPKPVYLLSGFVTCTCGNTMYVYHSSKNYACKACKTRISVEDMDDIYLSYLKEYLGSINYSDYVAQSDIQLWEKKELLGVATKERTRLAKRISELVDLRLAGDLSKETYTEQYWPLEEQVKQLDAQLPELEAEIDVRSIQLLSSDTVMGEIKSLNDEWPTMGFEQKRAIVETITSKIEVGASDITITLAYAPPMPLNAEKSPRHNMDSYSQST